MSRIVYTFAVALSLFAGSATADEETLCSCSPSKFVFTLDFSLSCPPVNVTRNEGIAATFCQISPFGDADQNIEDLVPVEVEYVDVLELGQTFEVLSQKNITGVSSDGDSFEYESIIKDIGKIPKVIQVNIFARNAADEPIVNFFAISFTNACNVYPTLVEGESAGWTQFTKLEAPPASACPAVPTDSPSETPTDSPSGAPTDSPSGTPTVSPSETPTDSPSGTPTDSPTSSPTLFPISMSMDLSTDPLEELLESITMSMEMSMATHLSILKVEKIKRSKNLKLNPEKKSKGEKTFKPGKEDKADKYDKAEKTDKKEKRRRLRVRPLVIEM